jgi:tetrahydromethanopterin S-methyltransferase subunit D
MNDIVFNWLDVAINQAPTSVLVSGLCLTLLSVVGSFLSTGTSKQCKHVGIYVALAASPFWVHAAITSYNLGIFITNILFTAMWSMRLYIFYTNEFRSGEH